MRELIRTRKYVMTIHAEDEMNDDDCTIFDVERAILTGRVVERQEEPHAGEWKYVMIGEAVNGGPIGVVCKVGATWKLVIITV